MRHIARKPTVVASQRADDIVVEVASGCGEELLLRLDAHYDFVAASNDTHYQGVNRIVIRGTREQLETLAQQIAVALDEGEPASL